MIRLARELLRIALQLTLLPLVWLFGAGAIATIVFAPIHFFKFGTGTRAEWDGFNVLVLADWKLEACSHGSGFTNWLSSAHNCRVDTVEPWLRALFFSPDSQIAGVVQIANAIFDLNSVLGCVFVAITYGAVDRLLPSQYA